MCALALNTQSVNNMQKLLFVIGMVFIGKSLTAQDSSLVQLLNDSTLQVNVPVGGTFKTTQIINMPTVEAPPEAACSL